MSQYEIFKRKRSEVTNNGNNNNKDIFQLSVLKSRKLTVKRSRFYAYIERILIVYLLCMQFHLLLILILEPYRKRIDIEIIK